MAIFRDINVNQTGGRGRSGLWTVLQRTDRSKLFSLTFDRGLNIRENGTWNQELIRKLLLIPEPIFLSGLRPSLLLGKFRFFETFLANPGKFIHFFEISILGHQLNHISSWLTHPCKFREYLFCKISGRELDLG